MVSSETSHGQRGIKDRDVIRAGALLLIPFLSLLAAPGRAASAAGPHGTVDLVAEQTTVQPDRPFWVGLHFQLEQGWHIYWTNPGDSGEPPRVKWTLPAGFQAGPLHWPIPRRIEDHSLIDYGYQNEVLLPVEITPPANLSVGSDVQLSATVNWLVCREICVPGRAALALTLPIANGNARTAIRHAFSFRQSPGRFAAAGAQILESDGQSGWASVCSQRRYRKTGDGRHFLSPRTQPN